MMTKFKTPREKQKGFSLIEVMVTVGILAIVSLGLVALFEYMNNNLNNIKLYNAKIALAAQLNKSAAMADALWASGLLCASGSKWVGPPATVTCNSASGVGLAVNTWYNLALVGVPVTSYPTSKISGSTYYPTVPIMTGGYDGSNADTTTAISSAAPIFGIPSTMSWASNSLNNYASWASYDINGKYCGFGKQSNCPILAAAAYQVSCPATGNCDNTSVTYFDVAWSIVVVKPNGSVDYSSAGPNIVHATRNGNSSNLNGSGTTPFLAYFNTGGPGAVSQTNLGSSPIIMYGSPGIGVGNLNSSGTTSTPEYLTITAAGQATIDPMSIQPPNTNSRFIFSGNNDGTNDYMTISNPAGANQLVINSAGNVGIGTNKPGAKLEITGGTTNTPALSVADAVGGIDDGKDYGMVNLTRPADTTKGHLALIRTGNYVWQFGYVTGTNNLGIFPWNLKTSGTPSITMTPQVSGVSNVGINTASPQVALDINGVAAMNTNKLLLGPAADTSDFLSSTGSGGTTSLASSGTLNISSIKDTNITASTTMALTSTGNMSLSSTAAAADSFSLTTAKGKVLETDSSGWLFSTTQFYVGPVGTFLNGSPPSGGSTNTVALDGTSGTVYANSFQYTSDRRLKENILPIENALEKILDLNGVTFNFKNDENKKSHLGLIAQDVEKSFPQAVNTGTNGIKSVDYPALIGPLVEAIKDQQNIILTQDQQIQSLNQRLDALEKLLQQRTSQGP